MNKLHMVKYVKLYLKNIFKKRHQIMLKKDNYTNSSERHHELMVKNGGIGWM